METANFRDVAESINSLHPDTPILRPGLLYRSANINPSSSTLPALTTVLDLRTKTERKRFPTAEGRAQWRTENVDFFNRNFEKSLVRRLSWLQMLWFLVLMVFGQRLRAVRIIARNVLMPAGLLGICKMSLENAGGEVRRVMEILAEQGSYPVVVHCTQGKDRTGLIMILVLLLLGVEAGDIEVDYMRSNDGLVNIRDEMKRELTDSGFGEEFAYAPKGLIGDVMTYLEAWGGVEGYCDAIGFGKDGQEGIRNALLVDREE